MPRYLTDYAHYADGGDRAAAYCNRCKRGFKSERGLAYHIRDSRRHWECPTCTHDADGWDALLEHCRETKCRSVCQGCDGGVGEHWRYYSNEFWQHVNDCNVCTECEEHFKSYHELKKHKYREHRPSSTKVPKTQKAFEEDYGKSLVKVYDEGYETESYDKNPPRHKHTDDFDYQCLMCDRWFTSYSGMILHLENNGCSDVDCRDLDQLAAECYCWYEFVYKRYERDMRYRKRISVHTELYFCPCCDKPATKLSGLFQHIEFGACEQTLDGGAIGSLRRHLRRKLW